MQSFTSGLSVMRIANLNHSLQTFFRRPEMRISGLLLRDSSTVVYVGIPPPTTSFHGSLDGDSDLSSVAGRAPFVFCGLGYFHSSQREDFF